jgi:glucose/mannose-6-phosphate isomerase
MKATVICITSGGKVQELAKKHNLDCVIIPSGMPPRSCLGYSMVQVLYVLHHLGYVKKSFEKDLKAAIDLLKKEAKSIQKEAKAVAKKLVNKMPIVYAAADFEGVAVRFRQQINENGKQLCWHHVLPEMNHNELVAWRDKNPNLAVIFLRHPFDHPRTQMRMKLNQQVIKKCTPHITEIHSKGESVLARQFYLIHFQKKWSKNNIL